MRSYNFFRDSNWNKMQDHAPKCILLYTLCQALRKRSLKERQEVWKEVDAGRNEIEYKISLERHLSAVMNPSSLRKRWKASCKFVCTKENVVITWANSWQRKHKTMDTSCFSHRVEGTLSPNTIWWNIRAWDVCLSPVFEFRITCSMQFCLSRHAATNDVYSSWKPRNYDTKHEENL